MFPKPELVKNDKRARIIIVFLSILIFIGITALSQVEVSQSFPFNIHVFATISAWINTTVAICLILALIAVKRKAYNTHKNIMKLCIVLSICFLISYIAHHLFAGETRFGDADMNGIVSADEKLAVGNTRTLYFILLFTHIPLAGIILPLILFTAYRALTGEYTRHKKLARIAWPIWFFVAVSGVIIYWMIRPYYN